MVTDIQEKKIAELTQPASSSRAKTNNNIERFYEDFYGSKVNSGSGEVRVKEHKNDKNNFLDDFYFEVDNEEKLSKLEKLLKLFSLLDNLNDILDHAFLCAQECPDDLARIKIETQAAIERVFTVNSSQKESAMNTPIADIEQTRPFKNSSYDQFDDIPIELIELLRNPSIRALLTPPTQLEIEVKEMVQGKRPVPAIYPTDTIKDKQLPEKFLMDHYSKYLDADCLYLDQLRVIDRGLVKALENRAYKHKIDIPLKRENSRLDKFLNEVNQAIAEKIAVIGRGISTRFNVKNT